MDQKPIYMFNALCFKTDGGENLYKKYLKEAARVIEELDIGAKTQTLLTPEKALIGDWDADVFFIVEYPSRQAFDRLIHSSEYKEILSLREDAIEKSLLIQCDLFR